MDISVITGRRKLILVYYARAECEVLLGEKVLELDKFVLLNLEKLHSLKLIFRHG